MSLEQKWQGLIEKRARNNLYIQNRSFIFMKMLKFKM